MSLRHIRAIASKDLRELIRDRRTIIVTVILPSLLYPLIALMSLQLLQLTQAGRRAPPAIVAINVPAAVAERLSHPDQLLRSPPPSRSPRPPAMTAGALAPAPDLVVRTLDAALERSLADGVRAMVRPGAPLDARVAVLKSLRALHLEAAVVGMGRPGLDRERIIVAEDDAGQDYDRIHATIIHAMAAAESDMAKDVLRRHGLDVDVLRPLVIEHIALAPAAESLSTRLASMVPLLLVLMALSGAFQPAIDLIAGERERGTLESLLSWPVARRDIFLGKLVVTAAAATVAVILNLGSLGITAALAGNELGLISGAGEVLRTGGRVLVVSLIVLMPLTVTMAAICLALSGLAASVREASNYLAPLLVVVMVAAMVVAVPDSHPTLVLDLIPVTGPVLALKACLSEPEPPWLDLLWCTGAGLAVAAVVVGWAVRLLESEAFCYPGLIRAGWGRFRRWGPAQRAGNGLESLAVYALAVAGLTLGAGLFAHAGLMAQIVIPQFLFVLLPALLHRFLGAYPAATALSWTRPPAWSLARVALALGPGLALGLGINALQAPYIPAGPSSQGLEDLVHGIIQQHGILITVAVISITPALCEEVLFRGTMLSGLRRSLGDRGAVVVQAVLFAALHGSPFRFLPQFSLGLALGALTVGSGSIIPAMILHGLFDATVLLVSLYPPAFVEHLDVHPLVAAALVLVGAVGLTAAVVRKDPRQPIAAGTAPKEPYTSVP